MEKRNLIILSIIASGIIGIAYASSGTIITDTSITTPSLTVSGTCTGCGSSEANYSTWSLQYNTTYTKNVGNGGPTKIMVGNDGYVFTSDEANYFFLLNPSGTVISTVKNFYNYIGADSSMIQSETGLYKAVFDSNNGTIYLYKNNVVSKTFSGGNCNGCHGFNLFTQTGAIAISPNGEYFTFAGENTGSVSIQRILLYKGS